MNDDQRKKQSHSDYLKENAQTRDLRLAVKSANPPIDTNGRFAELLRRLEEAEEEQS